MTSAVVDV